MWAPSRIYLSIRTQIHMHTDGDYLRRAALNYGDLLGIWSNLTARTRAGGPHHRHGATAREGGQVVDLIRDALLDRPRRVELFLLVGLARLGLEHVAAAEPDQNLA